MTKFFGAVGAVDHVNLKVKQGEVKTLLGPSGCGKSTTLRLIAGLEEVDDGEIYIGDTCVTSKPRRIYLPPEKRQLGMVFQSYAIWPHLTVFNNVAYPLRIRSIGRDELRKRVLDAISMVGLKGLEERYPHQLSGGQQQRVALARALVYEPQVLLLDEPLSNLDARLRDAMRFELKELQRRLGISTIYVTHDQAEAMAISDTVALMNSGKIIQEGTPHAIYKNPKNRFVSEFLGSSNFLTGKLVRLPEKDQLGMVEVHSGPLFFMTPSDAKLGEEVLASVRPELVQLFVNKPPNVSGNAYECVVTRSVFLGREVSYWVDLGGKEILVTMPPIALYNEKQKVWLHIPPEYVSVVK